MAGLESVNFSRNTLFNEISHLVRQSPCSGEVTSVTFPLFIKHYQVLWIFNSSNAVTFSICFNFLGCSAFSYCGALS